MCKKESFSKLNCEEKRRQGRRGFLKKAGILTGGAFFLSQISAYSIPQKVLKGAGSIKTTDNILVLIQLKGGNDGLNTIVPLYEYGQYKQLRKKLYLPKDEIIKLNTDFGLHNNLQPLKSLWDKGMMKIVNSVGYPNPNLSHFRSADIWNTGSAANEHKQSGWLARSIALQYPNYTNALPNIPPAIQMGEQAGLLFQSKLGQLSLNIDEPEDLYKIAETGEVFSNVNASFGNEKQKYLDELHFLKQVSNATKKYVGKIKKAEKKGKTQAEYGTGDFAKQLKLVAKLIKGNMQSGIYIVSLAGFDTHASQPWKHNELLKQLGKNIHAFYTDLAAQKLQNKVLTMTYSEFGRRPEENGSRGTDHGTSAPVLFFGGGLAGNGFIGEPDDLHNLDADGNLKFHTDFRRVYTTVLQNWMGFNKEHARTVLNGTFSPLNNLF